MKWLPVVLLLCSLGAGAQTPAEADAVLAAARLTPRLDAALPLDVGLVDENGQAVVLNRYFTGRPVLLVPVWYSCPNLCGVTLRGLVEGLRGIDFDAGQDFQVVALSIDPRDRPPKAAALKAELLRAYARPHSADGWHLLTGDEAAIGRVLEAAGVGYAYDAKLEQYAHPQTLVLVTPDGRVGRYLPGVVFAPQDLRLGLLETAAGKLGSFTDRIVLRCYGYDPVTGRYSLTVIGLLQLAGIALALGMGGYIGLALWRERRGGAA